MSFKKTALTTAVVSLLSVSASALAAYALPAAEPAPVDTGNFYFSAFGGAAFTHDNDVNGTNARLRYEDVGFDAGAAFGYRSGPFRYEVEYLFIRTTHDTLAGVNNGGETDFHGGFFNMFYTFNNVSDYMAPYIGAGIGVGHVTTTKIPAVSDDTVFAYQAGAGVTFSVDNDFDLDLGYRYVGASEPTSVFNNRYQSHTVNLGITYHMA
jgi:opacity protein-like surface antigen